MQGDANILGFWFRAKHYCELVGPTVEILNEDINFVFGIEFQQRESLCGHYVYSFVPVLALN